MSLRAVPPLRKREGHVTSGYAPDRLTDRHLILALMLASGWRQCDAARQLGYSENRVSIVVNSPLFQAQMAELREQLRTATIGDVMALIEREALPSVQTLIDVRDGAVGPGADNTRRLAANDLLDRSSIARKTRIEEERTVRIELSAVQLAQMQRALASASDSPAAAQPQAPAPALRSLDDAMAHASEP